jgi:hypothetical protein
VYVLTPQQTVPWMGGRGLGGITMSNQLVVRKFEKEQVQCHDHVG